jgi:hypothetical protein
MDPFELLSAFQDHDKTGPTRVDTVGGLMALLAKLPPDRKLLMWPADRDQVARYGLVPVVAINQDDEGDPTGSTACVVFEPATDYIPVLFTDDEWFTQGA